MKIQTNDDTGDIVRYPVTDPRNRPGHTIREVELPEVPPGKRLKWDNDADELALVDAPPKPLRDRIRAKEAGIDPAILAEFDFANVAYWLDRDLPDIARIIVDQTDVTGKPQLVQDAKAAVLAEFDI